MNQSVIIKNILKLSHEQKLKIFNELKLNLINEINEQYDAKMTLISGGYFKQSKKKKS